MTALDPDRARWHVLRTRATTPHTFAISPGGWRDRRLTLAARDDAADREERTYARVEELWVGWLRKAVESGRVSMAELELADTEFASVFVAGEELTSELGNAAWAASQFRRRFPTLMSEFAAEALTEKQAGSGYWSDAYVEPESEGDASILRGDHGLCLSQAAADALAAKKLGGFELMPMLFADEVPEAERGFAGP